MRAVMIAGILVAAVASLWVVLQVPVDVPDTSSPAVATSTGSANNWTSVGQTFVPVRDGLDRVLVILAAQIPSESAEIVFYIKETPHGEPVRTVRQPISSLPAGDVGNFRPHWPTERWHSFEFEPIPDSAGRRLYFSLEGKGVPLENTVKVLLHFHNRYPQGEAYQNEEAINAHVPFRTYSRGRVVDFVGVLGQNLVRGRVGVLGSPALYVAVVLLYGFLAAKLLLSARRPA